MFIVYIGGDKQFANQLTNLFIEYLNKGYTYTDIKTEIISAFYNSQPFRWHLFNNPKNGNVMMINLLKYGQRYYHKELKLVSKPYEVVVNIDQGILSSRVPEYFLEPVASYTVQEFAQYFYKTMPVDLQAQPMNKMMGMFKYKIDQFGIDKLLFMTDMYAQDCNDNDTVFNLGKFDEYSNLVDQHLTNIKSEFSENEQYYTPKKRNLFYE